MEINNILQGMAVLIVVVIAVVWAIRKIINRRTDYKEECGDCPLSSACKKTTSSCKK